MHAGCAGAVGGEQSDGHIVGLADVIEVGVEVGEVGADSTRAGRGSGRRR